MHSASRFRRPWSPEPFTPLPTGPSTALGQTHEYDLYGDYPQHPRSQQRREGSDVSVEALDLADYARTIRTLPQHQDPYPTSPLYPPLPLHSTPSRYSLQPPSLVSRGDTRSSNTHTSSRSHTRHRPFSLPPSRNHSANRLPYNQDPRVLSQESEVDISHFPAWSRNWYNTPNINAPRSPPDIYTPLPKPHLNTSNIPSVFDPGYIHRESDEFTDPYGYAPPTSSLGHDSTRDLLPWSNDPLDDPPPVNSTLKEERMRMLEREFGPKAKGKGRANEEDGLVDENGRPLIGTVDKNGKLVTQGPKKRAATRVLEILLTLTAGVPSIYAALIIKPKEVPPPSGKPPAFVLYILSVLTLLLLLYLFVLRPCCCAGKRQKGADNPVANGMMVLPVQALPGGKKKKKPKGGKKGKGQTGNGQTDVQVNLIVDPEVFGRREEEESEDEDEDWNGSIPGGYGTGKNRRRAKRRGVFEGLAMEESWKQARGWAKKVAIVDVLGLVLWGAAFVFIMIGKRCPTGGFEGWCNAYNVSTAAACLLSVAFGFSTFFNVKDLQASKLSPRTRT